MFVNGKQCQQVNCVSFTHQAGSEEILSLNISEMNAFLLTDTTELRTGWYILIMSAVCYHICNTWKCLSNF